MTKVGIFRRLRQIILLADVAEEIEPLLEDKKLMMEMHEQIMMSVLMEDQPPSSLNPTRGRGLTQTPCKP